MSSTRENTKATLAVLLERQLASLFGLDPEEHAHLAAGLDQALDRALFCFAHTNNKYYTQNGEHDFNFFHSGQYTVFLYLLSRTLYEGGGPSTLPDKVYYLNKALNGVDLLYEVAMPDVFYVDHPVGTVIGRAKIGRYFSFGQNNTLGNNRGVYPTIGHNVQMMAGAKVIGNCHVGDNVILSADALVLDQDVPDNSLVFGRSPNLIIKRKPSEYFANPLIRVKA